MMYGVKTRKQYEKLYKEAVVKLASAFGIKLPATPPPSSPPGRK
jgi:hypothetical protein